MHVRIDTGEMFEHDEFGNVEVEEFLVRYSEGVDVESNTWDEDVDAQFCGGRGWEDMVVFRNEDGDVVTVALDEFVRDVDELRMSDGDGVVRLETE